MEILKKIVEKNNDIYNKKSVTIAFLGDSVTQGCFELYTKLDGNLETIFDSESAFPLKVKKILNYLCPAAQINIINSGISGDKASGGVNRFDRDIAPFNPDLVVVGFALNDSTKGIDEIENYIKPLGEIFDKVKSLGAECIFLTPNLMNDRISPHLKEDAKVVAERSLGDKSLDFYVESAKKLAAQKGVAICDVYSKWKKMQEYGIDITELLSNKINHPTREMTWLPALMLVETILEN